MASEYRNRYSKKYSKVSDKELHTVIPFTSDLAGDKHFNDLRRETVKISKEYVSHFNSDLDDFKTMIDHLTEQKSEMTNNERKALVKIKRGARTIADFNANADGMNAIALARLKSGMEELLGGISTMQKYGYILDNRYPDNTFNDVYDMTAEYGQLIFQTGRRFKKGMSDNNLYNLRLKEIDTLRNLYRENEQYYSSAHFKYTHRMDVTLVAIVSATLHCNVTEAVERVEWYRRYQGGPDLTEMSMKDFYHFSEAVYPEIQRKLDEARAKAEARAKMLEEVQARVNIIVGMRDVLNANYRPYTDDPFEPSPFGEQDIWDQMTEEVEQEAGFDIKSVLKDVLYNPESMTKVANFISNIGESILNPLGAFAKAISKMQVGTDLGMSFSDLMGIPLASLFFTLNLSLTSINTLSSITSASTELLSGALTKAGKLMSGDDDDDDDDYGFGSGSKSNSKWNIVTGIGKVVLSIVSVVLKGISIGFTVISSVISTGFSMFTGLLSSMLKMLKEIFKTSQVMEAISNILSLCLTMFFMPFFMTFGNALLETVFEILIWTRDNGMTFIQEYGETFIAIFVMIAEFFVDHKDQLLAIATEFIETVCASLLVLAPDFMQFVSYMMEAFVANKETLMNMLTEGINVGKELLANKIFQMYLYYGTLFMQFIDENADWIKKVFDEACGLVEVCLNAFSWVMDHLLLFCFALGGAIGTLSGLAGVAALTKNIVEDIISLGLKEMGPIFLKVAGPLAKEYLKSATFKAAIAGGITGSLLGLLFWHIFFSFGRGGYIPATPGGVLSIVAEKETEYIIPESKMYLIRGHNNIVLSFNDDVYMLDNPTAEIKTIATQVAQTSYYR